jgi:hypothetical protein
MNIKDFESISLPDGDLLKLIFQKQKELAEKYHDIESKNEGREVPRIGNLDINSYAGQRRLKDFAWRITEEIAECMLSLKLRAWKQTPQITDVDHYQEELIDALHFFVELLLLSGLDAEMTAKLYLQKHEVNKFRQRSNY